MANTKHQEPSRLSLQELQARAKRQHRSVASGGTPSFFSDALETRKPLSILDLKGLGKEHWRGVDPSKHC